VGRCRANGTLTTEAVIGSGGDGYLHNQNFPQVPDAWLVTGDRMERRGDRVYFIGREDSLINIARAKVIPEDVESAFLDLPGVLDLRAFAVANPIIGFVISLAWRNRHERPPETTFLTKRRADPVRGRGAMRCEW